MALPTIDIGNMSKNTLPVLKEPDSVSSSNQDHTQQGHRRNLITAWSIPSPASPNRILDIGCGQGDMTEALAHHLLPNGHVVGIDPGPGDYGSPQTLAEAQAEIKQDPVIGDKIHFHLETPAADFFRAERGESFYAAVLAHCLWYFDSRQSVRELFAVLGKVGLKRVCIAEHALSASLAEQEPHVLAAQMQGKVYGLGVEAGKDRNVRTALSPDEIKPLAVGCGWKVGREGLLTPEPRLLDGRWEVDYVLGEEFRKGVIEGQLGERVQSEILTCIDQVRYLVRGEKGNRSQKCKDDGHLVGRPGNGMRGLACFEQLGRNMVPSVIRKARNILENAEFYIHLPCSRVREASR